MTRPRRPGRLALVRRHRPLARPAPGIAAAWTLARPGHEPATDRDRHPLLALPPSQITVPAGTAVTFVLRNDDPIDHEWIVGDAAVHERHRTGTEPVHGVAPDRGVDPGRVDP